MLITSHRTCFSDLNRRLSQFIHNCPPFLQTAILISHWLSLYDIDFIHDSLPPILGRAWWVSVSLCIKSQSSSHLAYGGWSEQQLALAPTAVRACHILSGSLSFQAPISRSQSLPSNPHGHRFRNRKYRQHFPQRQH